jgi:Holliday junction resolvase
MKTQKQIVGLEFEKKANDFLKERFEKVVWLSQENFKSTFDFKCINNDKEYLIECKYSKNQKHILRGDQAKADFAVINFKDEILLIKNKDFKNYFIITSKNKNIENESDNYCWELKRAGASYYIKLGKELKNILNIKDKDTININILFEDYTSPHRFRKIKKCGNSRYITIGKIDVDDYNINENYKGDLSSWKTFTQ